jgi:hypothetical protein
MRNDNDCQREAFHVALWPTGPSHDIQIVYLENYRNYRSATIHSVEHMYFAYTRRINYYYSISNIPSLSLVFAAVIWRDWRHSCLHLSVIDGCLCATLLLTLLLSSPSLITILPYDQSQRFRERSACSRRATFISRLCRSPPWIVNQIFELWHFDWFSCIPPSKFGWA